MNESTAPNEFSRKVVVTGATGLIGSKLLLVLLARGYRVTVLTRNPERARAENYLPVEFAPWNPQAGEPPLEALDGAFAVVHLAGEPVAGSRWTAQRKRDILDSRVLGTRHLVAALGKLRRKPTCLVSSSAIGFYGNRGDETLTEASSVGAGFLPEVCRAWEQEAFEAEAQGVRTVALRTGIVLDPEGGALAQMLPPFRLGFGGPLGGGRQWMSWIHVNDLVDLILHAIEVPSLRGPVNGVAPAPARNADFGRALGAALGRPAFVPTPAIAVKLLFGEMSEIVLASQRVEPRAALESGFRFAHPDLQRALNQMLRPAGQIGAHELRCVTWVPQPVDRAFEFFSDAGNLEAITPPWLKFRIDHRSGAEMAAGHRLEYSLRIHGIPLKWKTLIEHWEPGRAFVDRQTSGPYSEWIHRHEFRPLRGGTLILDSVAYRVPLGPVGVAIRELFVQRDLREIFGFRSRRIAEILGRA